MSESEALEPLRRLLEIMRTLRSPEGCPWDREQTVQTLRRYAVEEVYEVIDAIDRGDLRDHCDELGDLLLQVVFQAQIREEEGHFGLADVARAISDKLVRRHPHVFGDLTVADSDEVVRNWDAIKSRENAGRKARGASSALDGVPVSLPALLYAAGLQKKAARVGFDWPEAEGVLDKVEEELREVRQALASGEPERMADELGDLLFAAVNLCRHQQQDPEQILRDAAGKFARRFRAMEGMAEADGFRLDDLSAEGLDRLWERAKQSAD